MPQENDQAEAGAKKPLNEEEESDGTASDDSSEKDGDSDEKIDDDEGSISSESQKKGKKKVKKTKKDKDKTKKKTKKKKEKKDKKDKDKKDKKKKKLPPVEAPDYVHVERRSHHSRVSAITIPKPLQKIAKLHSPSGPNGIPQDEYNLPEDEDMDQGMSGNFTLPKTLTIGGGGGSGDDIHLDDSQRSARISLLSVPQDGSLRSIHSSALDLPPDERGHGPDTSLLDG
mmetsp:Transcript_8330/g.20058  ORF Transcript_8330/g.20058 Transcript_8330/m.20058 type:complete len:228 (-) Transcript_8330:116-799(-)